MARSLTTRKPNAAEMRQLQLLAEDTADSQVRRRAEGLLAYALGLTAVDIAQALQVHPNTIYTDLHAFDQTGLASLKPVSRGGAPAHLTAKQQAEIWRLADQPPTVFDLPEGRWSLSRFRDFLIHRRRLLKAISCEHLRRVLKKGGSGFGGSSANWPARIPSVRRFWPESAMFSGICPRRGCCSSMMSNLSRSKPMVAAASVRPNVWC